MGFSSVIWDSLVYNSGKAVSGMANSLSFQYLKNKDGNLIYRNNRAYNSVVVHIAKQTAAQLIEHTANTIIPKYVRYIEKQSREVVLKQQDANRIKLIENGQVIEQNVGSIQTKEGKTIYAKDKYGTKVPEALFVYYDSENSVTVTDNVLVGNTISKESFTTVTVWHVDLAASINVQSDKNVILSKVQGRDYTRKELVSGGDISFSVSGEIVGPDLGVYPSNDVKKFIQIMQYGGVLKVNHIVFDQFNVKQILVTGFTLKQSDCKNIQPYTFSCVAVEPDEEVVVTKDTIGILNQIVTANPVENKLKLILDNKLAQAAASAVSSTSSNIVIGGIDSLIPNI